MQNRIDVLVHFVWATWDRLPLISDDIERELYRYVHAICLDHGCPPVAVGGIADHVHLLISLSNTITLADLMEFVRGGSSRFVSDALRPGEWFKWQGSYGAFSVSPHEKAKVIAYIRSQKQHHADGTTIAEVEQTHEFRDRQAPNAAPAKAGAGPKAC